MSRSNKTMNYKRDYALEDRYEALRRNKEKYDERELIEEDDELQDLKPFWELLEEEK